MAVIRTIRFRLTLWYVVLVSITLAIFGAGVYFAMTESLYSNLDDSLESRAEVVASVVVQDGRLAAGDLALPGDPTEGEEFARVFDASGEVLYDNSAADFRPTVDESALDAALAGRAAQRDEDAGGAHLRIRSVPVRSDGEIIGAIEVGLSRDDARDALASLLYIIALAYPAALVITTVGGAFLASRALSPIDRVTRVAQRINAEDLSQRLDMELPDDEVGRLARTFDEMIARLDEAFRRQRQFTADASHELRTPLTAIKGQTEVALQRDRSPEEYQQVLQTVNGEVDRMIRLVSSLLTLARADAAQIPISRERVDVGQLVADVVDQVRTTAEAKGLAVTVERGSALTVSADQDLLLQLLLNLLDNAVTYTPPGGSISAGWRQSDGIAEINVRDTGLGISAEHLPHIFDRFYRADPSRSRAEGGVGLGLSISRWIAEAHGGSLSAESTLGQGTTFVVRLPAA